VFWAPHPWYGRDFHICKVRLITVPQLKGYYEHLIR
jgi:hypothetical protein